MTPRVRPSPIRWPFWLLLAAWFCANCPQRAVYRVVAWVEEARSFSHQRTLTRDVAFLLGGEKGPERFAVPDEAGTQKPPLQNEATEPVKKIELACENTGDGHRPHSCALAWSAARVSMRDRLNAAPPHGPPRDKVIS